MWIYSFWEKKIKNNYIINKSRKIADNIKVKINNRPTVYIFILNISKKIINKIYRLKNIEKNNFCLQLHEK